MALNHPPSVSVTPRGQVFVGSDPDRTVVWVRGEHDIATAPVLAETMVRALTLDDADLVIDLSGVEFMDASTVGAVIRTRNLLGRRSKSLVLRAPSPCARRLLDACHLGDLVEPDASDDPIDEPSAVALATWVAVPAWRREDLTADSGRTATHDRVSVEAAASGSPLCYGPPLHEPRHESG